MSKTPAEVFEGYEFALGGILAEPVVENITKINLGPGDVLIVNLNRVCNNISLRALSGLFQQAFPGNRVVVTFDIPTLAKLPRDELLRDLKALVSYFEKAPVDVSG